MKNLDKDKNPEKKNRISENDMKELTSWMKDALGAKVLSVKESDRLTESPAIIAETDAGFRRMNKIIDPSRTPELPKQHLEVNPSHPMIVKLNSIRTEKPNLAILICEQIFDDALISAGLLDDSRLMLPRLNKLLTLVLETPDDIVGTPKEAKVVEEKKEEAPKEESKKKEEPKKKKKRRRRNQRKKRRRKKNQRKKKRRKKNQRKKKRRKKNQRKKKKRNK